MVEMALGIDLVPGGLFRVSVRGKSEGFRVTVEASWFKIGPKGPGLWVSGPRLGPLGPRLLARGPGLGALGP